MKQPTVPTIYQEQRTILPEANIQIAQGIDWDSIGKNAANLGIEIVSKMREDEHETRVLALQTLQKDIARGVDTAAELNDWGRVDAIKQDYRNQIKNFVDGDIDDSTYIGSSLAERKLLSIARGFDADLDANIEKGKRGWSDTIAFENYERFRLSEEETLLKDPTYVDQALGNLEAMYKGLSNADINEPLNPVGYSANTRKLLFEIQKDRVDLLKAKEKMGGDPMNVQAAAEQARIKLIWAASRFGEAKKLHEAADKLAEKQDLSESEKQEVIKLRSQALKESVTGMQIRQSTMNGLVEQAKSDIVAGYPEDFVGPPDIPEGLSDPASDSSISTLMEFGLKAEDARAIIDAYEAEKEVGNKSTEFNLARKAMAGAVSTLKTTVDSIVSVAENKVRQINAALSYISEDDPRRVDLTIQREALIANTQRELYNRTLAPVLPPAFKESKRLLDFMDKGLMAFVGPSDLPVRFDEDNIDVVTFLTHNRYGSARDIYAYAQEKYNNFAGTMAPIPSGRSTGGGRRGTSEADLRDQRDTFALWTNQPMREPPTAERTRELSIRGMISLVGTTPDGNLIPLMDAVKMYEEGKFRGPIPTNRDIFMQTPYFGQLIDLVRSSTSVEEAQSIIDRVNKAFNADKVGEDIHPIPSNVIDPFMILVRKGTQPNLTEQLFLMMPDVSRSLVLDRLKKDPEFDQLRLGRMQRLNDGYIAEGKRSAPKLYLQSVEENPRYNALVIASANATVTAIRALPEKEGREETDAQKIARRNKEIIEEELVPKFLASFPQEFGITQEMLSGNIQLRKSFYDRFLPTIVSSISTSINQETGRIELSDNVDELVKDGVRDMVDSKWRWDKRYETWTTEEPTPQFVQTSIPKQRFEAMAGPDVGKENRLTALMLSQPQKLKLDDTSAKILGATVSDYPDFSAAQIQSRYEEDPYATLALLSMKVSSVGNVTDDQMFSALRQMTSDESMPKDNLTLMSIATASRMISVDTLPQEYPSKLKAMTLQVREDILSGAGRFRAVTTNKPSRNPTERGSLTTTVVVFDGDKPVFEFQPQQYNYNKSLDVVEKMDARDLEKSIRDNTLDQGFRDRLARLYLLKSGETDLEVSWDNPLVPGNEDAKLRYFVDRKTNHMYRHFVGSGSPVKLFEMPVSEESTKVFIDNATKTLNSSDEEFAKTLIGNKTTPPPLKDKAAEKLFKSGKVKSGLYRFNKTDTWYGPPQEEVYYTIRNADGGLDLYHANRTWIGEVGNLAADYRSGLSYWDKSNIRKVATLSKQTKTDWLLDLQSLLKDMPVEKSLNDLWLEEAPTGRSNKNIFGGSYVLPKDARSVLIEDPVIPIDKLGVVPTAPISKDNPVNAEIIRSKDKFYLVSKANLNIDQHFGVFGSIEDAKRYLEALQKFVDN
jgi:hypothetical protein